jgi:hypothetical protein
MLGFLGPQAVSPSETRCQKLAEDGAARCAVSADRGLVMIEPKRMLFRIMRASTIR